MVNLSALLNDQNFANTIGKPGAKKAPNITAKRKKGRQYFEIIFFKSILQ